MKSLLDRYIPSTAQFRPNTVSEFFALRLAQKLDDAVAVRHYVSLLEGQTASQLLVAYRRAIQAGRNRDLGRQFLLEVNSLRGNGHHDPHSSLIAIRVERRTVAAAVFNGLHLEYADSRQLSSDRDRALSSAVGFIIWMLNRFPVESVALEAIPNGNEIQRRVLHNEICQVLRDRMLPIWEIPKVVLLESFGRPPLRFRTDLREVATQIWPVIAGSHAKLFVQDAAVLGLHVQTERLFIIN
jgi:hypothetical protein